MSPWLLALGIVALAEAYSIGLMLLCRRQWGSDRLALNNEVAGFKFAVVGVFFAVLLAFVVVAVWEDYRDTETAVRNEAKALAIFIKSPTPCRKSRANSQALAHICTAGPRFGMADYGAWSLRQSRKG